MEGNKENTYFIQKEGVYGHGVFWIGEDIEKGKQVCLQLASEDDDDYHRWVLMLFKPDQDATKDPNHTKIFECRNGFKFKGVNID